MRRGIIGVGAVAVSLAAFALAGSAATLATVPSGFIDTLGVGGLNAPTAMAFAPGGGRLYVAQQGGALRVVRNGKLMPAPFVSLTVDASGERGLLGVAFDPAYSTNHFVYVYYTVPGSPPHNRVSRFTASGDKAVAGSEVPILELDPLSAATNHNGGAIHFGPDGKLYVAVGDNANRDNAQLLTNLHGKILRINSDATIPTDNPFFGTATGRNRAIWALGLRNPFTFAFQRGTGRMFINDVGAGTYEEIDDGAAGANYGWPSCEGPCSPPNPGFRDPVLYYAHNGTPTPNGCAIIGGAFYNPPKAYFPSTYVGKYFFTDLCSGWIERVDPAAGFSHMQFASGLSSPVQVELGPDGSLYYLQRGANSVRRISWQGAPTITRIRPTSGPRGTWVTIDGTYLAGATSVRFSGTVAPFVVVSDLTVRAQVPAGATSGRVTVTTAKGTATSPSAFTVTS